MATLCSVCFSTASEQKQHFEIVLHDFEENKECRINTIYVTMSEFIKFILHSPRNSDKCSVNLAFITVPKAHAK